MLRAYEGYLEKGRVYPLRPIGVTKDRLRVIITILDEPTSETSDTWEELDKIVSGMSEKPRFEDFPRCQLERGIIKFEEV